MERSQLWNPSLSQLEGACPRDPAFLAPSANSTPPEREHPIPKHPQTRQVSWYCVVVEVALHDRLEPSSGLGHGIVHGPLGRIWARTLRWHLLTHIIFRI